MKGNPHKLLSYVVKDFQRKGFGDMDPEERSLILKGAAISTISNLIPVETPNHGDLEDLVKKATRGKIRKFSFLKIYVFVFMK